MKPNEDRIWDMLIEDALREGGVDQPAQPVGDHTRRLLTPVGAPGIDRGRSLRGHSRRKWLPAAVTVALLVMVAAILYAGIVYLPQLAENRADQPQASEDDNQSPPRERRDNSPKSPKQTPEPQPQPEDSGPVEQPDDSGPIAPQPEQPKPQPEPKPDDTVEQPKPEPKPDDTVERPKEPDEVVEEPDTETAPEWPDSLPEQKPTGPENTIYLLSAEKGADFKFAQYEYIDESGKNLGPSYKKAGDQTEFTLGTWFKCRKPVDLAWGGFFFRLDGEFFLTKYSVSQGLKLYKGTVFVDSRTEALFGIGTGAYSDLEYPFYLDAGMALFEVTSRVVEISTYDGSVGVLDKKGGTLVTDVPAGKHANLKRRKVGEVDEFELKGDVEDIAEVYTEEPFLKGLTDRVLYREDFDSDPQGRLREGKLEGGTIKGDTVFWGYPENLKHERGLIVRLRVRFTNAASGTVTQFCPERNDNYSIEIPEHYVGIKSAFSVRNDHWYVLCVPVDEFLERTKHEGHPQAGETFQNISIQLVGENAQVELDWVELIRAVK